jgi:hypothetical protein
VIAWHTAEWCHPARLAPCHSPPPDTSDGGPAEVLTPNILQGRPRALSAAPALLAQGLRTRPLTPRISPLHEKNEYREVRVVRWRIPSIWSPNAGTFFTRGHQLTSIFYLMFRRATHPRTRWRPGDRICHQHTSRPPAPSCLQRPAPTEKEMKVSFLVKSDVSAKLVTKNTCGKSLHSALRIGRPIQNAVCHDTC